MKASYIMKINKNQKSVSLPLSEQQGEGFSPEVVYNSEKMKSVMRGLKELANTSTNVLITGEVGVGKEHIARAFHSQSEQRYGSFLPIDCLAMLDELLEMELFGRESMDFKGHKKVEKGAFEIANTGNGLLFLNHFEDLSFRLQTKLLRALRTGKVYRLGGQEPIETMPRIVFSANKNLLENVQEGRFCTELFAQMKEASIEIPPLRERKEDIIPLIEHFLQIKMNNEDFSLLGKLSGGALHCLLDHNWSGNLNELKNLCDTLPVFHNGRMVKVQDLPKQLRKKKTIFSDSDSINMDLKSLESQILGIKIGEPKMTLGDLEKNYILHSLQFFGGNKTRTATVLGITVKTLYNKLNKYSSQK